MTLTDVDKRHFGLQAQTPKDKEAIESMLTFVDDEENFVARTVEYDGGPAIEISGPSRHGVVEQLHEDEAYPLQVVAEIKRADEDFVLSVLQ